MTSTVSRVYIFGLLLFVLILSSGSMAASVSNDAVGYGYIAVNKADAGVNWMYNNWLGAPRPNSIKAISKKYALDKAEFGFYPVSAGGRNIPFALLCQFKAPLEKETVRQLIANETLNGVFDPTNYRNIIIHQGTRPGNQGTIAYFISGSQLGFGYDVSALKKSLNAGSNILGSAEYVDMKSHLPGGNDVVFFFNGNNPNFANTLSTLEKRWKMSLLLSSREMAGIILGINFVDGDKITGTMVFKAKSPAAIKNIKDDANFLGEAIRRKFSQSKIVYKKQITVQGNYVTLSYEMTGLKPLFKNLFVEGGSSLIH